MDRDDITAPEPIPEELQGGWVPGETYCQVVVPSHHRPDKVDVLDSGLLRPDQIILCVADDQVDQYRDKYPDVEYSVHPADMIGLSLKRGWIMERHGNVCMLDDDARVAVNFESYASNPNGYPITDPDEVMMLIQRHAASMLELGVYLGGLSSYNDVRSYCSLRPFKLVGYVRGTPMFIMAGSKITFTPRIVGKTDYWASAMNAFHHRMTFVDLRYTIHSDGGAFVNEGGTAGHRTTASENRDNKILRRTFGSDTFQKKKPKEFAGTFNQEGVTFRVPWG